MSTLELKWTDRNIGVAQTHRRFLDFVVDGSSFHEMVGDLISPLGWGELPEQQAAIDRLLLRDMPDLPNGRTSIYVCPECGDLDCGAVSAVIKREGDSIIWQDFGYENTYEDVVHVVHFEDFEDVVLSSSTRPNIFA